MNSQNSYLLLAGSPKKEPSTSESLGAYLLERLNKKGLQTETLNIHQSLKTVEGCDELLAAVDRAGTLILASPLYVDSLPAKVIRVLEIISKHRQTTKGPERQRMLAILNSGFPEARHNETATAICRCFARKTGLEWAGGLALGAGEVISGGTLSGAGWIARNVTRALDLTAKALAEGKPAPIEAITFMSKPLIPTWLYIFIGGRGWKKRAKKHKALDKLHARPYQKT